MGFGNAASKSLLQCNVGNRSPVYLCSLYPEKSESLQLNLEFEEVDEVIFSVIGPRSIHLSGFYLGRGRNSCVESGSYPFVGSRACFLHEGLNACDTKFYVFTISFISLSFSCLQPSRWLYKWMSVVIV